MMWVAILSTQKKENAGGIEIHHVESTWGVKSDNALGDINGFAEANVSIIAQLGCKFGFPMNAALEYKNTEKFHLINTKKYSHSITHLTQTLYFYSYLLESNFDKFNDTSISSCLNYLNRFYGNIKTHTDIFISNTLSQQSEDNTDPIISIPSGIDKHIIQILQNDPNNINYLLLFVIAVYSKVYKYNNLQKIHNVFNIYDITEKNIIDVIGYLSNRKYHINILDKEFFADIRKQCDYINDKNNIGYKACIAEYRNFIIVNKDNKPIETNENLGLINGYNSLVYKAAMNEWEAIVHGASCKMIQGLYFGGKAKVTTLTS